MQRPPRKSSNVLVSNQRDQVSLVEKHPLVPISKNLASACRPSLVWPLAMFLVGLPLVALISLLWVPIYKKTVVFMVLYYLLRGTCITAGYHRLWAHKSYSACTSLKFVLAVLGAGAGEGGIKKWARDHRAHHRYVDTDQDPYSVHHGFFHAHIGWVLFKNNHGPQGTIATGCVDIVDLKSDPIVMWQEHNYWQLLVLMGYVLPTVISGLCWGDFIGGFIIVGCLGTSAVQQCTFCVNSVAHWIGEQPFEATGSPRDHFITAFLTSGEGYHNFHHEFPIDYRNGIRWYDYDPTKWVIWLCGQIGLATNLRQFPHNEIEKGRLQRRWEVLEKEYKMLDWGMPVEKMPVMEWEEFQQQARTGCNLIVIRGFVYEVSKFVTEHPGGAAMITEAIGKDATEMFGGGVHRHSNAATNLLDTMRMAVIGKVRRTEGQGDLNDD